MESYLIVGRIDQDVDWSVPWLAILRNLGLEVAATNDWRAKLNSYALQHDVRTHTQLLTQFVQQKELPDGVSYEAFINSTGKVPTRENLHDFFNALVWLTYPKMKAQLNALQARQIAKLGIGKSRGAARDAATLFDENAAILAVTSSVEGRAIVQELQSHQWESLFVKNRERFLVHAEVFLFGHAIMEKLVRPYKAITAHSLVCWVDSSFRTKNDVEKCNIIDQQIGQLLAQKELLPAAFSPLPVLGIPRWWPNQTAEFYADASVFRPKRQLN